MIGTGGSVGGVAVEPDPPVAGGDVTITVTNGAGEIRWRVAPDGKEKKVKAKNGKAKITLPAGTGGKSLSIKAGKPPHDASERIEIVESE